MWEAEDRVLLVMDWVEGVTLSKWLRLASPEVARTLAKPITQEVLRALRVLHSHGIAHRDLHPGNVMISGEKAVLLDFCHCRLLFPSLGAKPLGGVEQAPPEMVPWMGYFQADLFAVGALALLMLNGFELPPVHCNDWALYSQRCGERQGWDSSAVEFLQALLQPTVGRRPTIEQALQMDWFAPPPPLPPPDGPVDLEHLLRADLLKQETVAADTAFSEKQFILSAVLGQPVQ
eukprot:TRINITY_DN27162_c0_g1_i1.p1 TRINITY_DN27162_c0_g1~~TRINITY_DN27162_c0_g1_i1.p1  ORF type:complete len:233 (-),score=37.63 TRINITY_DN27162_c0_g1_i1:16-714(-)